IEACKALFADETVSYRGEFFSFDEVVFEPKPVQRPRPPILVGGESKAALRRAAKLGDGWLGMGHTFDSAAAQIATLTKLREQADRPAGEPDFQIIVGGAVESSADIARWE